MLARALIVLLLVLNVGVAAWWLLRPAAPPVAIVQPEGIPSLQLVSEAPGRLPPPARSQDSSTTSLDGTVDAPVEAGAPAPEVASAPNAAGTEESAADADADSSRCYSFGPFASAAAAGAARTRLQSRVQRSAVRTQSAGPVRGWRVYLPPLPSEEAAKAMAKRVADAGFSDYLIMHNGADANAIALGRYGGEATARRRVETLRAAGFTDAKAEPIGGGEATFWLDVASAPSLDAGAAQALAGAPGRQAMDCTGLE